MSATNFETLLKLEYWGETAFQSVIQSALVSYPGVSLYRARETTKIETPCIGLILAVGDVMDQYRRVTVGGQQVLRLGVWQAALRLLIKTRRTAERGGLTIPDQDTMRAVIRWTFQNDALFTPAILPYHEITRIREAGTASQFDNEKGIDDCIMNFNCVISIRTDAWPAT